MSSTRNHRQDCVLTESYDEDHLILKLKGEDILLIAWSTCERGWGRHKREQLDGQDIGATKGRVELKCCGYSLVLTGNEWERVQKETPKMLKGDFRRVYRWEQRGRLEIMKKYQKLRDICVKNEADAAYYD